VAATEDVDVEVVDGLASIVAGVEDEAIAVFETLLTGYPGGGGHEVTEHGFVPGLGHGLDVNLRDDEDMDRRLGMNVGEGEDGFIFVEGLDRDGAGGDFAEQTVHGGSYFLKYFGVPVTQGL
jgi:hypothetical protein